MRSRASALVATILAVGLPALAPIDRAAHAQGAAFPIKQIALTQDIIDAYIAAEPDVRAVYHTPSGNLAPSDLPKLDAAVAKHGFRTFDSYNSVSFSIKLVSSGFDPSTKAYVGEKAVLQSKIKALQDNKSMPAKEKADRLEMLQSILDESAPLPEPFSKNIELIKNNYDKIIVLFD